MAVCEICKSKTFSLVAIRIREGSGRIIKCKNCGLVIQDLGWNSSRLRKYYEKEYQATNSLVTGRKQLPREHFDDRMKTIVSVYKQVEKLLKPKSRVLEVGCGTGELLYLVKPKVAHCAGIELNSDFVDFIKKDLKIEAYNQDVNKLRLNEKFDLVICISTLDHLPNPLETLITMRKLLRRSGKIYVEVPNIDDALNAFLPEENRSKYNEFFWHRAHIFYFTRKTISDLFKKAGLKVKVSSRHEYTLKNFLNWYYLGKPQSNFVTGLTDTGLFAGKTDFEKKMNLLFLGMDKKFKGYMAQTFRGDNLCCEGRL